LTRAERNAVDIKRVDAKSTDSAALVELYFKGRIADKLGTGELRRARVRIELVPATGARTVITDRGTSRRPREGRRGTPGRFDVIRNGRRMLLLVERLPRAVERVVVTTSGPAREGRLARGDPLQDVFDELAREAFHIDTPADAERELRTIESELEDHEVALERLDARAEQTIEELHQAQQELNRAETGADSRAALMKIKRLKDHLRDLTYSRTAVRGEIKLRRRWRVALRKVAAAFRQCNDRVDNDGDGATDLADPGCVDAADNDEEDKVLPLTCPAPGGSTSPFAIINTPKTNELRSFVLRRVSSNAEVLTVAVGGSSGGPAPLPGEICGAGVTVSYQWVIYENGAPFGLPNAPPGQVSICVFIEADNPAASGNPGGQDASLRLATGTAPR
jgi:hypothetical protein